ncbi:MAG TPA: DUF4331 family protein [Mycobacteriales bacterium]|nr:DUF4331 family protein [Mycobacteriales bacterium]
MARSRAGRGLAALAAAATTVAAGAALIGPGTSSASSHREAPLIASDPQADNTDVYAFVSPDKPDTVTLIANWIPFEEPAGGPNFYPFATNTAYNIKVDSNGDALADLTYRWTFTTQYLAPNSFIYNNGPVTSLTDENLLHRQTYDLEVINAAGASTLLLDNAKAAPSHVGNASMPDYAALRNEAITPFTTPAGQGVTYAGQADDPFFLDLRVFDLLYGGNFGESGQDTLNGFNTNTIAIQVPKNALAIGGNAARNPVVGVWSTTERRTTRVLAGTDTFATAPGTTTESGEFAQVSRLGNPLVNEVVIPVGQKDRFNNSTPANDGQFLDFVTKPELPKLVEAVYGVKAPAEPRNDLVAVFLTGVDGLNTPALNQDKGTLAPSEVLRLNMSIAPTASPNRLGVIAGDNQGFPNGRRLADDVIDIALQVVEGELVGNPNDLGDSVHVNDRAFGTTFPYVALPHSGSTNKSVTGTGTGPKPGVASASPSSSGVPTPAPTQPTTAVSSVTLRADFLQITSGNTPTLSGVVRDGTGATVGGASVLIRKKSYGETDYTDLATVTTTANGTFSLVVQPDRQTSYGANVGDVRSNVVNIRVSTRVNITSPRPGAVRNPVTFTGSLQPAYSNVAVGLGTLVNGRFTVLQQTVTDSAGRYSITRALPAGTATYVIFTSAHQGTDKGSKSVRLTVS